MHWKGCWRLGGASILPNRPGTAVGVEVVGRLQVLIIDFNDLWQAEVKVGQTNWGARKRAQHKFWMEGVFFCMLLHVFDSIYVYIYIYIVFLQEPSH